MCGPQFPSPPAPMPMPTSPSRPPLEAYNLAAFLLGELGQAVPVPLVKTEKLAALLMDARVRNAVQKLYSSQSSSPLPEILRLLSATPLDAGDIAAICSTLMARWNSIGHELEHELFPCQRPIPASDEFSSAELCDTCRLESVTHPDCPHHPQHCDNCSNPCPSPSPSVTVSDPADAICASIKDRNAARVTLRSGPHPDWTLGPDFRAGLNGFVNSMLAKSREDHR